MPLPVFDEAAIRAVVTPARAVAAIREAFRADGEGRTIVPAVINLTIPAERGEMHVKTAYVQGARHIAVKVASGFDDNPARGLPAASGTIVLFAADTGWTEAVLLDNAFLTDIRTGAAGAVAAECLARADAATVGVIGTGVQARHQVACLREVRPIRRAVVWGRSRARLEACCADIRSAWDLDTIAASGPEAVCREADILVTATAARAPIVQAGWLRPGMHVTAVGSDSPGKQELEPACLGRADLVVVDRLEQCAAFGELAHAIDRGVMDASGVHASLGAIVAGTRPGRTGSGQITIADLTGVGFQDTAIASEVYRLLGGGRRATTGE